MIATLKNWMKRLDLPWQAMKDSKGSGRIYNGKDFTHGVAMHMDPEDAFATADVMNALPKFLALYDAAVLEVEHGGFDNDLRLAIEALGWSQKKRPQPTKS